VAANVPKDAFDQLPEFFLALKNDGGEDELVFLQKKRNQVLLIDQVGKKYKFPVAHFIEKWTGTLIAAEAKEIEQKAGGFKLSSIAVSVIAITALAVLGLYDAPTSVLVYAALSAVGLYLSYLIIKEQLGIMEMCWSSLIRLI